VPRPTPLGEKECNLPQKQKAVINDENLVDVKFNHQIKTLIDITHDTATQKKNTKGFYQSQNYNTFVQACSFRSQVFEPTVTSSVKKVDKLFGDKFTGKMPVWTLNFYTEVPIMQIQQDISGIPIHDDNLEIIETTDSHNCNTIVESI